MNVRAAAIGLRGLVLVLSTAASGAAQELRPPLGVSWRPAHPVQGSLLSVLVRPESLALPRSLTGTLHGLAVGQPLHFEFVARRHALWALAAVPLDAADSLLVWITTGQDDAGDTLAISVPVAGLTLDTERLRVPPEFGEPPDSAVAVRAAADEELVATILRHAHDTPRLWREPFMRPVTGHVTSAFAVWREFNGALAGRHLGVDLAAAIGAPVRAANRGVVVAVAELYYGGLTVLIDHGGGLVTTYAHLSRATVAVGDTVGRGETIARAGAAGRATGPHLHWSAYYGTVAIDPLALLSLEPPR